jgi:hypothetical protein
MLRDSALSAGYRASRFCPKILRISARGNEAMRDIAVGLIVVIFIALFMIYVYQPSLIHTWLHRLFY